MGWNYGPAFRRDIHRAVFFLSMATDRFRDPDHRASAAMCSIFGVLWTMALAKNRRDVSRFSL